MEYARLGRSLLEVSRVGLGCAPMSGYDYGAVDDADSIRAIRRALDLGITLFDTADVYGLGRVEEILAKGLGDRRHDVVVATKVGVRWNDSGATRRDLSPAWIVRALEDSLRRLRLDSIPLYQIHWPDPDTPLNDTLETLVRCREQGKIQHLGCCNFDAALLKTTLGLCRLESLQIPYSLAEREAEGLFAATRDHGLGVLTYNTLAHGLLSGKYLRDSVFTGTDLRTRSPLFRGERLERNFELLARVQDAADRLDRLPVQVAIRWVLDNPAVTSALAGAKHPGQVEGNAGACGWNLPPVEKRRLDEAIA